MAASSRLLQGEGVCVQECRGLRGCGAEAGCSRSQERGQGGGREGIVPSGKGSHRVVITHTYTHTKPYVKCLPVTAYKVITHKTHIWLNMYHLFSTDNKLLFRFQMWCGGSQVFKFFSLLSTNKCSFVTSMSRLLLLQRERSLPKVRDNKVSSWHKLCYFHFLLYMEKVPWLPVKGSKNKLMQAFQELDKMTHADLSWLLEIPPLSSHIIMLNYAQWTALISTCSVYVCRARSNPPPTTTESSTNLSTRPYLSPYFSPSACMTKTHPLQCFQDFQPVLWKVLDGEISCQGDTEDVAATTVQ